MEAQHIHKMDGISYGFNILHLGSGPGQASSDIAVIVWASILDSEVFIDAYGVEEYVMADLDPKSWAEEQFFDNDGADVITYHNKTQ
tara:strand:- start:4573 stop:4833 length:261 start_codon:yes stop_codon:yes gene_type:complete